MSRRIDEVLRSWNGTPYMSGQQLKGEAVDCVHFGAAVADELYGWHNDLPDNIALDACSHDAEESWRQVRKLLAVYPQLGPVRPREDGLYDVEPGDLVVVGPASGGPGHLMVVGARPNTMWEADKPAVREVGIQHDPQTRHVKHVYRFADRWRWLKAS